jgi:hypothetical protein
MPNQEDVLRLDVAVDDVFFVGGVECRANLAGDVDHLGQGQLADPTQSLVQVLAFEQLHDDKRRAVFVLVEVSDLDDVGMAQRRDGLGLVLKALVDLGIRCRLAVQDLDREDAAGADVPSCIDRAHAAAAEQRSTW